MLLQCKLTLLFAMLVAIDGWNIRSNQLENSKWTTTHGVKSVGHRAGAREVIVGKEEDTAEKHQHHKKEVDAQKDEIRIADCSIGGPAKELNYVAGSWLNIFNGLQFDCVGEVLRWEFYAQQAGTFWASIWRQVDETKFRLVGSNRITVHNVGKYMTQVSPASRIKIQEGDMIGIFYDSSVDEENGGVVAYEDSRYTLTEGITKEMLSHIHNSPMMEEQLEIGTMVDGVYAGDVVKRLPALTAFIGIGSSGGALINMGASDLISGDLDRKTNRMMIPDPTLVSEVNGVVVGWDFFAMNSSPITFQVWRQSGNENNYNLKGQTVYDATYGRNFISLEEDEYIPIRKGDTIGYYQPAESVLPHYSIVSTCSVKLHPVLFSQTHVNRVQEGDNVPFETETTSCRTKSFAAVIRQTTGDAGGALMMVGYDAVPGELDTWTDFITITDPSQSITKAGVVIGWNLYVQSVSTVYLQVWRPTRKNYYRLVGQTEYHPEQSGIAHITLVGDSTQIPIQVDDTLGFYVPRGSVIPYSVYEPCQAYNYHRSVETPPNQVIPGVEIKFMTAPYEWDPCRSYSYSAEIKMSSDSGAQSPDTGTGIEPQEPEPVPIGKTCGTPYYPPSVNSRIVGGIPTLPHSWPWMASLQTASGFPFCGGTLVGRKYVVTAAHCMRSWDRSKKVVLGMHNKNEATGTRQERRATALTHYSYISAGRGYDIAILRLDSPIDYSEEVSPVCLPQQNTRSGQRNSGRKCYTTGWGTTSSGGSQPNVLLQVGVPLLSNQQCNRPTWYGGMISDTMICAGYEEGGKDSCQGDSGGPLVCQDDSRKWELIGVVSFGDGCANVRKPGIYAYVPGFRTWIDGILN